MSGNRVKNSLILVILIIGIFFFFAISKTRDVQFERTKVESSKKIKDTEATILIVGDVMLDRNVRNVINEKGFDEFFAGVRDIIKDADISVANLEGPFTDYPSITASLENKALQFTFDPKLTTKLADLGFDILGLANNHTLNFGYAGLETTRRYIGQSGMIYYGDPLNKDEISTIITKNNISVAFVGFHEFNYINFDKIFTEIGRLRTVVDVVIVTPHWGVEYQKDPTEKMREWAHVFIDAGADAVIGTHPHVVGETEIYNNKKIYYSLGNFAFDQYFSEDTMNGLTINMTLHKNQAGTQIEYHDIPVRIDQKGVRTVRQ